MKLNVLERLTLLGVLQAHVGNFLTLGIVNDAISILAMTDKEFKEFGIKQVGGQITWNPKGSQEKKIEIGEKATEIIVEDLKKMDQMKKMEQKHFSLYKKFVEK